MGLVEGARRVVYQFRHIDGSEGRFTRKGKIGDELIAFASARGLAWRREGQQAGYFRQLLSVMSMNGEDI